MTVGPAGARIEPAGAVISNVAANIVPNSAVGSINGPGRLADLPQRIFLKFVPGSLFAVLLLSGYLLALCGFPIAVAGATTFWLPVLDATAFAPLASVDSACLGLMVVIIVLALITGRASTVIRSCD